MKKVDRLIENGLLIGLNLLGALIISTVFWKTPEKNPIFMFLLYLSWALMLPFALRMYLGLIPAFFLFLKPRKKNYAREY